MSSTMKGYYFSQIEEGSLGPRKKVESQIKAFAKKGIELRLVESPFQLTGRIRGNFLLRQLVCRLPFTYVYSKHKYEERYRDADVFYIRFLAGDFYFLNFIKKLRKNSPNAVMLLELADYPTTWYMTTSLLYKILYFPIILKDWLAGRQYKKYIDRIVMPQKKERVFGIPVISFENGIDIEMIEKRTPVKTDVIRIIAVAAMCNFHGYDRLLEGLHQYYMGNGERRIELHMVGGKAEAGNELLRYKEIVKQYSLEDYVFFYGKKEGKELDCIYNKCNLAVASLGMYRIGYKTATSLKIREYLAKGMPIITGSKVDIFENEQFPYFLEFPNDDSYIKIEKIVDFYDTIYVDKSPEELNDIIRQYAMEKCDMSVTLRPVIDYIRKNS